MKTNLNNKFNSTIETEINSDPILRFLLREAKLDYKLMDHQIDIQIACFKIAFNRWLDKF